MSLFACSQVKWLLCFIDRPVWLSGCSASGCSSDLALLTGFFTSYPQTAYQIALNMTNGPPQSVTGCTVTQEDQITSTCMHCIVYTQ